MRTYHECLPCFVRQALGLLRRAGAPDERVNDAMRAVFRELAGMDFGAPPPLTGRRVYRALRECGVMTGDPYAADKKRFNEFALRVVPEMQRRLGERGDTLGARIALAIAANIIDLGKSDSLTEQEARRYLDRALDTPLDPDAVRRFGDAVGDAHSVLFLCDNAGEIVFDRLLVEALPCRRVTCAVRGVPVINDATLDDTRAAGLAGIAEVISSGSDLAGTVLEECSPEFRRVFDDADVVIAKGQGNFETLSDVRHKRIFFLLQVKCPVIARDIGLPVGTPAIVDTGPADTGGHGRERDTAHRIVEHSVKE